MKVMEVLYLNQPQRVIDLVVAYQLDDLAPKVGLEPVGKPNEIGKLMSHRTYTRVGRRVRQREGKVIT